MRTYDVVIIGGGLGGLTCAGLLAKRGKKVLLLESNPVLGGCQATFKRKKFIFEPCLHAMVEFGPGGSVTPILRELGIDKEVEFMRLDPPAQFVFPDLEVRVPAENRDYMDLLKALFPHEAKGIDAAFDLLKRIYEGVVKAPQPDPVVMENATSVFADILGKSVRDKKLQAVIASYWGYFIYPPSRISGVLMSIFTGSATFQGIFLPRGGIIKLVDALEQAVLRYGGEISTRSTVKKITISNGKASGVILHNDETIGAHHVVSNVDALTTLFSMVGEEHLPAEYTEQIKHLEVAHSAFNVCLGVKGEGLHLEEMAPTIFVYPDYDLDGIYDAMMRGEIEKASFCIGIPTLVNPSMAPEGHHVLIVYVPIPYRVKGIDWKEHKEELTQRFITMVEKVIPGLRKNIVVTEAATPQTLIRYTGNTGGAVAGWAFTPAVDLQRPQNKTPIEGLYLAGHWTVPGPGTGSAMLSGYITASLIQ